MYRGFNLNLNWNAKQDDEFHESGKKLFQSNEANVKETLKGFALNNGTLDGTKMQSNWFPKVQSDIFISHSHKDQKRAIALAGWLFETFGIKAFIDSCIWGYADDLLKLIDDKHCYKKETNTYDYNLRNYSTSHVHMMLSTALTMMIDNSECLFFLNTPNSISTSDIVSKTESPWIYAEIAMTQMLRQNIPRRRLVQETKYFSKGGVINEQLKVQYDLDLTHLTDINVDTLISWQKNHTKTNAHDALDRLYELKPVNKNFING
jgi:hypothetical protein